MCLFSFFRKKQVNEKAEASEIKGAEAIHDSGLSDQEAAGSKSKPVHKAEALKEKGKDPYKTVQ